jgi:hypothetical protein
MRAHPPASAAMHSPTATHTLSLVLLALLLVPQAEAQRVPVTTSSAEARAHFEEGVRLANATHWEAARDHFDGAIAVDPDFALAYAWQSSASPEANRQRFLDEAAARAGRVLDGERLLIEAWAANLRGDRDRELDLLEQAVRQYTRPRWRSAPASGGTMICCAVLWRHGSKHAKHRKKGLSDRSS